MQTLESKLGRLAAWVLILGWGSAACSDPSDDPSTSETAHREPAEAGVVRTEELADAQRDASPPDDSDGDASDRSTTSSSTTSSGASSSGTSSPGATTPGAGVGTAPSATTPEVNPSVSDAGAAQSADPPSGQPPPDVVCYANQQRYSPGDSYVQEGCVPQICVCQDTGAFECTEQSAFTCSTADVELEPNEVFDADECTRCYCCADGLSCSPLGCEADCEVGVGDADERSFKETWDAAGCLSCECRSFGRVFCSLLPECAGSCIYQGLPYAEGDEIEVAGFEAECASVCRCNAAGAFECGQAGSCSPAASCPGPSDVEPVNALSEEGCECQPDGFYLCAN